MVVVARVVYCARVVAPWFAFSPPETLPVQELFDQVRLGRVEGLLSASSDQLPGTGTDKVTARIGKTPLLLVGVSLLEKLCQSWASTCSL